MVSLIAQLGFWLCAAFVVYTYAVYPVAIWMLARASKPRVAVPDAEHAVWPSVTILIAAHNEASVIGERVKNVLALDYPADRLKLVVASDGSKDKTCDIVRSFSDHRVEALEFTRNRGKSTVLGEAVAMIDSDIVILSDANTFFDADAVKKLVRWFVNPQVGVVCGKLVLVDHATGKNVDGMYWRYETFLKTCEGKLGALLGSNGAIYAVKRGIFPTFPEDTLVDDFVIPLMAKLGTRCEIVYDPAAIAGEEVAPEIADEFKRRSRIGAGGYQAICRLWRLLNPLRGWVSLAFLSHKVLRWLCPFFLIGMLAFNLALLDKPVYIVLLFAQLFLCVGTPLLAKLPGRGLAFKVIRLGAMFSLMNAALLAGFFRWLRRSKSGTWTRTARVAELAQESP